MAASLSLFDNGASLRVSKFVLYAPMYIVAVVDVVSYARRSCLGMIYCWYFVLRVMEFSYMVNTSGPGINNKFRLKEILLTYE